jgi:hypothetical protein
MQSSIYCIFKKMFSKTRLVIRLNSRLIAFLQKENNLCKAVQIFRHLRGKKRKWILKTEKRTITEKYTAVYMRPLK